uniref:CS domain-containing protein n=2 Tax=Guillardia theta (strain CCMP2712) TaxID=905079 RepID=A0A0C3SHL3_GUITC
MGGAGSSSFRPLSLRGGSEPEASSKYDRVLWDMLQQHPDEIHFLNTVFNFLQRRTPCFNGPRAKDNYEILIDTLCHQKERYLQHIASGGTMRKPEPMQEEPRRVETRTEKKTETKTEPSPTTDVPITEETPADGKEIEAKDQLELVESNEGGGARQTGLQIPVNNGGRTDRYVWAQSLTEVTADIFLPPGMTPKMLKVETTADTLKVGELALGTFPEKIFPSETTWTVEKDIL